MTEEKKLYRSHNRTIGGVAGGLAEHFNVDPVLIRAAFVLAALFGGGGGIIYIILWIVIPERPYNYAYTQTAESETKETESNSADSETINSDTNNTNNMENQFEQKKDKRDKRNYHGNLTGGIILITLGVLFLIDRFVPQINFGDLWPVILIVIGITILMRNFQKKNTDNQQ